MQNLWIKYKYNNSATERHKNARKSYRIKSIEQTEIDRSRCLFQFSCSIYVSIYRIRLDENSFSGYWISILWYSNKNLEMNTFSIWNRNEKYKSESKKKKYVSLILNATKKNIEMKFYKTTNVGKTKMVKAIPLRRRRKKRKERKKSMQKIVSLFAQICKRFPNEVTKMNLKWSKNTKKRAEKKILNRKRAKKIHENKRYQ